MMLAAFLLPMCEQFSNFVYGYIFMVKDYKVTSLE